MCGIMHIFIKFTNIFPLHVVFALFMGLFADFRFFIAYIRLL